MWDIIHYAAVTGSLQLFNITLDTETATRLIWNVPFIMNEDQVCLIKCGPSITKNTHTDTQHVRYGVKCMLPFTSWWQVLREAERGLSGIHNSGTVTLTIKMWSRGFIYGHYCSSVTAHIRRPVSSCCRCVFEQMLSNKSAIPTDMLQQNNYCPLDSKFTTLTTVLYLWSAPAASFVAGTSLSRRVHRDILCIVCLSIWKSKFWFHWWDLQRQKPDDSGWFKAQLVDFSGAADWAVGTQLRLT